MCRELTSQVGYDEYCLKNTPSRHKHIGPFLTIMQPWELMKLFENLQRLELRQHPEKAYKDRFLLFEQLTALKKLNSLKVHWHHSHISFSLLQVLHSICLTCTIGIYSAVRYVHTLKLAKVVMTQ